MRTAGSLPLNSGSDSDSDEKLSVFSGHDTVIAPVLAALGLYENELCVWPPYASRIVFELWEEQGKSKLSDATGSDTSLYVRVIFNGKDLTHRIPACKAERDAAAHPGSLRVSVKKSIMCSLEALEVQVQNMLGHHTSLKAAC